jgi:ribonuclease E
VRYARPTADLSRNGVEGQLDAMFSPQVTLKSGGYIVINQTEALVSIDVNSGRSTREHNRSRTPRSRPTWKPPTKSPASCACATSPA